MTHFGFMLSEFPPIFVLARKANSSIYFYEHLQRDK